MLSPPLRLDPLDKLIGSDKSAAADSIHRESRQPHPGVKRLSARIDKLRSFRWPQKKFLCFKSHENRLLSVPNNISRDFTQ